VGIYTVSPGMFWNFLRYEEGKPILPPEPLLPRKEPPNFGGMTGGIIGGLIGAGGFGVTGIGLTGLTIVGTALVVVNIVVVAEAIVATLASGVTLTIETSGLVFINGVDIITGETVGFTIGETTGL